MRPEARWWLRAGERDLSMARELKAKGFYEGAAFHCQQGAEKFLKALLLSRGGEWQRTHSCVALLAEIARVAVKVPAGLLTGARKLDLHYIDSRYPNGVGGAPEDFYDISIADELLSICEAIRLFVQERLGDEGKG